MKLKKLNSSFYHDNKHLNNALDNYSGRWDCVKIRGYGIVLIEYNSLTFAIPLRSNIKHKAAYITVRKTKHNPRNKGLDFSKAMLIHKPEHISDAPFVIPAEERKKLRGKEEFIRSSFEKYIENYIIAVHKSDTNRLNDLGYRYSTLINYHSELDLD